MRIRIPYLLIALTMGALLIPTPAVMAKKKLTWWIYNESAWQMARDAFQKQNPGVEIQIIIGDMDKFYTMITAGLMPDIWGPYSTPGIHADVNRNWVIDLGPYIKRDSKELNMEDFFPGVMRQFKVGGKQYSLPIFMNADYYFYNKQKFAQAGLQPPPIDAKDKDWDWDQMVAYAQKTTVKDGSGKVKSGGLSYSTGTFDFPNYFHMWGAEPYSKESIETSVPQTVHWNTPEMVTALTKIWELKWKYNVAGGDFSNGSSAASIQHGWSVIWSTMRNKKLQWGFAPLPWGKTNSGTLWPDGWRISKVCKDKELAWKFVKFLVSPSTMKLVVSDPGSSKYGSPAVRKSVFKETMGRDWGKATGMDPDSVYKVHEQADDVGIVKYQETICLHADLSNYIDPELDRIWANKVEPKAGATNVQKVVDKALPMLFKRWLNNIKFTGADKGWK